MKIFFAILKKEKLYRIPAVRMTMGQVKSGVPLHSGFDSYHLTLLFSEHSSSSSLCKTKAINSGGLGAESPRRKVSDKPSTDKINNNKCVLEKKFIIDDIEQRMHYSVSKIFIGIFFFK